MSQTAFLLLLLGFQKIPKIRFYVAELFAFAYLPIMPDRHECQINRVFIGRVREGVSKEELEDYVKKEIAGIQIKDSWVARSPPGFAFIELYSREDTDKCIKYLDGKPGCSHSTLAVEQARETRGEGGGRGRGRGRSSFRGGRDSRPRSPRYRSPQRHRSPVPRRAMSPPRREQRFDS